MKPSTMLRPERRYAPAPLRFAPFGVLGPCAWRNMGGVGTGNVVFRSTPLRGVEQGTGLGPVGDDSPAVEGGTKIEHAPLREQRSLTIQGGRPYI